MSILIKGMKMPTCCDECHFNEGPYCLAVPGIYCDAIYDGSVRHKQCPLIELPPHGRLIDADALSDAIDNYPYGYRAMTRCDIARIPTIIEADGDDLAPLNDDDSIYDEPTNVEAEGDDNECSY